MSEKITIENIDGGLRQPEVPINRAHLSVRRLLSDFITGLRLEWVSATSIKVKKGACALEAGDFIYIDSDITISPTLGVSTWYHVYAYESSPTPSSTIAIEAVTTAPVIYFGTARSKTGDDERRYLGSFKTNASSQILKFRHIGNQIRYLEDINVSPLLVLSNGVATSETNVTAGVVPVTSNLMFVRVVNLGGQAIMFGTSDDGITLSSTVSVDRIDAGTADREMSLQLDSSQQFSYMHAAAPAGGLYISVKGYIFER